MNCNVPVHRLLQQEAEIKDFFFSLLIVYMPKTTEIHLGKAVDLNTDWNETVNLVNYVSELLWRILYFYVKTQDPSHPCDKEDI